MTPAEHAHEARRLKRRITTARVMLKQPMTLAEKLVARKALDVAVEALRQHKLNYYELTNGS